MILQKISEIESQLEETTASVKVVEFKQEIKSELNTVEALDSMIETANGETEALI